MIVRKNSDRQKRVSLSAGFTLLELLVVLVILGALILVGLRSFISSQMKARDTRRKSDIEQFTRALELFRGDKGYYPIHDAQGRVMISVEGDGEDEEILEWGESFTDPTHPESVYMAKLPRSSGGYTILYQSFVRDPSEDSGYREAVPEDGQAQAYRIFAKLENAQDEAIADEQVDAYCDTQMESSACNYVVSSPNLPTSIGYTFETTLTAGGLPDEPTRTPTSPFEGSNTPTPTSLPFATTVPTHVVTEVPEITIVPTEGEGDTLPVEPGDMY